MTWLIHPTAGSLFCGDIISFNRRLRHTSIHNSGCDRYGPQRISIRKKELRIQITWRSTECQMIHGLHLLSSKDELNIL